MRFAERGSEAGTLVIYADDMTAECHGRTIRRTFWEVRREGANVIRHPVVEIVSPVTGKCQCREAMRAEGVLVAAH